MSDLPAASDRPAIGTGSSNTSPPATRQREPLVATGPGSSLRAFYLAHALFDLVMYVHHRPGSKRETLDQWLTELAAQQRPPTTALPAPRR